MVKKKKTKKRLVEQQKVYLEIPEERYKKAYREAPKEQKKYIKAEYKKIKKGVAKQKAKIALGGREARRLIRRVEEAERKELPSERFKEGVVRGTKRLLRPTEGRKKIKRREVALKGFLGALGVTQASRYSGPGRPRGTYKHGIPIHEYKKKLSRKKAIYQEYKQQQQMDLQRRGLTPEQIQQLQMARATEELQQPQRYEQQAPQQVVQQQIPQQRLEEIRIIPQRPTQRPQVDAQQRLSRERGYPQHTQEVADDELRFQEWRANNTVSPNTQRLLTQIRRIQNKGKSDNIAQQRQNWERRLVQSNTNLLLAHQNKIDVNIDFTGVDSETNILMAPSVFKENPENNILRPRPINILDMRENKLRFF